MALPEPTRNPEVKYTKIFINNEWVDSASGKTFPTINPMTEEVICQIQEGDKADVEKAVKAAQAAFERGSPWRTMDASERGRLVYKLSDLIERDQVYLASLETLDNGKPFSASYTMDTAGAIKFARYISGWADKVKGDTIPADGKVFTYTRHEPFGVAGLIIPWNFPLFLAVQKLTPALVAGNTVVMKPAEQTPLTALYLMALTQEVGFPPGVINMVPGYGPTAGAAISSHPDIRIVSFTGSTEVGRIVMEAAAKSNLKKVCLELGGKSPNVVFPDVDLDDAVRVSCDAVMFNMGECCCAGTRTFVHEDIYDEFIKKTVEYIKGKTVGDPFDKTTALGPLVDKDQFDKVQEYLKLGVKEGAKLQCGGSRHGDKGYYIQPTLFSDVNDNMKIATDEIFGPVQSVFKFKTLEEAIKRANDTTYGLGAAVQTKDINTALTMAHSIDAGTVWVNNFMGNGFQVPFGGYKQSGIGRENSQIGVEEFLETKTVAIQWPMKNS